MTTGELVGIAAMKPTQSHHFQQVVDLLFDLGLGPLADLQPVRHVIAHGHVLERRIVLEHESDVATLRRHPSDVATTDRDGSGVGLIQASDGT